MIIQTTRLGELEYTEEEVLTFSKGIPGFKQFQKFKLVSVEDSPFMYLQSLEEGSLSFIVVNPFEFFRNYEFDLSDHIRKEAGISSTDRLQILNIVSVRGELKAATVNLAAPIVIDWVNRTGVQHILPDGSYLIHQPLFAAEIEVPGR